MSSSPAVPDFDYDHLDPTLTRDQVWDSYSRAQARCPVVHNDRYGGHLHVLGYEQVRDTANRPEDFLSKDGAFIPPSGLPRLTPIDYDGAEHEAWRTALAPFFSPKAVRARAAELDEMIDEQIDLFAAAGSAELFSTLADPVPVLALGRMVGLSAEDSRRLRRVATATFDAIGGDGFSDNLGVFQEFINEQLEQRRHTPGDDFLSELARGRIGERELTDDEVMRILVTLLLGGHHSTAAAMGGVLHHILTVPDLHEVAVAGGPKLSALIEESLRLTTPLHIFARTAAHDTEIGECPVPAGERLFINYAAANHDPARFDTPEEFRLDRRPNPHVAFGFGPHLCLGRHLARAELKSVVTRLLSRLPDIRLDGEVRYTTLKGGKLIEIEHLPVTFTPEDSRSN